MFRTIIVSALALLWLTPNPVRAAEEWGLPEEEVVRFEAKVVDILCELSGDCPAQCGGGKRQLGLLNAEGVLVLALKNKVPFAGTVTELIDFCGKQVVADGLFSTNRGYKVFALQFVRKAPDGKWRGANRFTPKWAKQFGFAANGPEAERWFENDPRVNAIIKADGKLGLGPAVDAEFLKTQ
ncbi:MAG: hypothetical protein HOM25_19225 [Rhodospirillaceae bacterium]|jgi:hypothetical protein|nr:hypothetical protein [Rhodospirillaceae bacterium]MBT5665594.1 hypothetical protein [Rhodospirillaceae bacterium]MBT5809192.1 hypothetical protein [Rhodospirillaceae bacterium]